MKLSVWSSFYIDLSPEDAVLEYEKHGYSYCELSDEHSLILMDRGDAFAAGAEFRRFAEEHGVQFTQGHLLLKSAICNPECIPPLKRQLDLFRGVGVKNAVLHSDSMPGKNGSAEEMFRNNVAAVRELADYVKDDGITICLENLTHPLNDSADALLRLIEAVDRRNVGICLDTGHLNLVENRDQAEFIQKAGRYIRALHLANNDGSCDQHILPYGRGSVDILQVVREMKKLGYEGLYNLEIPGERKAPLEIRGLKLEYIKKMFDYIDKITGME